MVSVYSVLDPFQGLKTDRRKRIDTLAVGSRTKFGSKVQDGSRIKIAC